MSDDRAREQAAFWRKRWATTPSPRRNDLRMVDPEYLVSVEEEGLELIFPGPPETIVVFTREKAEAFIALLPRGRGDA